MSSSGAVATLWDPEAFFDGLEESESSVRTRIVRPVLVAIDKGEREVALADVERDGDAGREVDDVERIIGRVVVARASRDGLEIDRRLGLGCGCAAREHQR